MGRTARTKGDASQREKPVRLPGAGNAEARNALRDARERLEALQGQDASTGQWSLDNCAAMLAYWQAEFLEAQARSRTESGAARLNALSMMKTASDQAGEWEKRKAGAMQSCKVDLLIELKHRLDAQDAMADEMLEIEE